jgi:hypothetical protein
VKYTQNDLNYVLTYARLRGRAPATPEEAAELIATVRREVIAVCEQVAKRFSSASALAIHALLDEAPDHE